jgi:hypothetical protein
MATQLIKLRDLLPKEWNITIGNFQLPSNEELLKRMKKIRKEIIEQGSLDAKIVIKVPKELILPLELRESVFSLGLKIMNKEKYEPYIFENKEIMSGIADELTSGDIDEALSDGCKIDPKSVIKHNAIITTCKKCRGISNYHVGDLVIGFNDHYSYDSLCNKCFSVDDIKKNLSSVLSSSDLVNDLLEFLKPVVAMIPHSSSDTGRCELDFQYTSSVFEWVCFLIKNLDEDSLYWFVNCNPKSKFYGYILLYGHQGELEFLSHVSQFLLDMPFFKE